MLIADFFIITKIRKNPNCSTRDERLKKSGSGHTVHYHSARGSIPRSGRSLGVRNVNSLQYSCLENSMNRGAWQAIVHGVSESQT